MSWRFPLAALAASSAVLLCVGLQFDGGATPALSAEDDPFAPAPAPADDNPFGAPAPAPPDDDPFGGGAPAAGAPDDDPFSGGAPAPTDDNPFGPSTPPRPVRPSVDVKVLRGGETVIVEELASKVTFDFHEEPLFDLVEFLRLEHRINVVLHRRALDDVGLGTDTPITIRVSDVSLRAALELALEDLDLTWTIRDEVLLITTPEEDEQMLLTRVYDVAELVTFRDSEGVIWEDYDALIETITRTVEPNTWDEVGGPASVTGANFATAKVLVVAHTYRIQEKIAELLADLHETAHNTPNDGKLPLRDRPPANPMGHPGFLGGGNMGGFGGMGGAMGGMGMGGMGMGGLGQPSGEGGEDAAPAGSPPAGGGMGMF